MRFLWVAFIISLSLTLLLAGMIAFDYAGNPYQRLVPGASVQGGEIDHAIIPGTPSPAGGISAGQVKLGLSGSVSQLPSSPERAEFLVSTPTLTAEAADELPLLFNVTAPLTATVTVTPTQGTWQNFLPLVMREIAPTPTPTATPMPTPLVPRKVLVCASPNVAIPDNNATGKTVSMTVSDPGQVVDVRVYVRINHTWVGDLTSQVEHLGLVSKLFDRPGVPEPDNGTYGCSLDNIRAIFDEVMAHNAENICFNSYIAPAIGGSFTPARPFSVFFAQPASGTWNLRVLDESVNDIGTIVDWCLDLTVVDGTPTPTPAPTPVTLPADAEISGMSGLNQKYPLDCESRSAVDWAKHWGVSINEDEFFWGLPTSVNPEKGFVGSVYGTFGQVPPDDYGVHAPPIAERLRQYGLRAQPRKYLRWDDLRAEIATGRPVIVWIVDTISPGAPRYYNPGVGPYTITVPYEHTMIVTGYDSSTVTLLDGAYFRTVSLGSFLDSWSALGNMAVVYVP